MALSSDGREQFDGLSQNHQLVASVEAAIHATSFEKSWYVAVRTAARAGPISVASCGVAAGRSITEMS